MTSQIHCSALDCVNRACRFYMHYEAFNQFVHDAGRLRVFDRFHDCVAYTTSSELSLIEARPKLSGAQKWTSDMDEVLKTLYFQGLTKNNIAQKLSENLRFGYVFNMSMVKGRIRRLGLQRLPKLLSNQDTEANETLTVSDDGLDSPKSDELADIDLSDKCRTDENPIKLLVWDRPEYDQIIKDLYPKGESFATIVDALNKAAGFDKFVSRQVQNRVFKLQLKRSKTIGQFMTKAVQDHTQKLSDAPATTNETIAEPYTTKEPTYDLGSLKALAQKSENKLVKLYGADVVIWDRDFWSYDEMTKAIATQYGVRLDVKQIGVILQNMVTLQKGAV